MNWPNTISGANLRQPQVLTVVFTSTLKPTLLNEARFGMTRQGTNTYPPVQNPLNAGSSIISDPIFYPKVNGVNVLVDPNPSLGIGQLAGPLSAGVPNGPLGSRGLTPKRFSDTSPRFSYADTITWTRGRHSFKGGAEIRHSYSDSVTDGNWGAGNTVPNTLGGSAGFTPILAINSTNVPGIAGTTAGGNQQRMMALLDYQAGSVASILQYRFINSATQTAWNDPTTSLYLDRNTVKNEFSLFFKDDWKVNNSLTLNLGLRYEWYGAPWVRNGLSSYWDQGSPSIFGISGRDFSGWMPANPSVAYDSSLLVKQAFVGPGSPNPNKRIYNDDWNNLGPAVGFAWQLPWFGKGKTTFL